MAQPNTMNARRVTVLAAASCVGVAATLAACGSFSGESTPQDAGVDGALLDGSPGDETDASSVDAGAIVCPPIGTPSTLFVDGLGGSDMAGNGTSAPYRSITKALAAANAASSATTTICVRGGPPGTPTVYSEGTTGEVFPLELKRPGITLVGEGQDRVRIEFTGAPDSGVNAPDTSGQRPQVVAIWLDREAHDATLTGFTQTVSAGDGIYNLAPALRLSDATFATRADHGSIGALVGTEEKSTLARVRLSVTKGPTGVPCVVSSGGSVTVSDSTFEGCAEGLTAQFLGDATVERTTFRSCDTGIWVHGAQALHTASCTFDTCQIAGVSVGYLDYGGLNAPFVWTSAADTFTGNFDGADIGCTTAPAASTVSITGARFRLQQGKGLDIACPLAVVARDCSFEDGKQAAVVIEANATVASVDLGAAAGGNTFQPTSHPNLAGICLEAPGNLRALGGGFRQCPPSVQSACAGGADVSAVDGGVVDVTGCKVAP